MARFEINPDDRTARSFFGFGERPAKDGYLVVPYQPPETPPREAHRIEADYDRDRVQALRRDIDGDHKEVQAHLGDAVAGVGALVAALDRGDLDCDRVLLMKQDLAGHMLRFQLGAARMMSRIEEVQNGFRLIHVCELDDQKLRRAARAAPARTLTPGLASARHVAAERAEDPRDGQADDGAAREAAPPAERSEGGAAPKESAPPAAAKDDARPEKPGPGKPSKPAE